MKHSIRTINKVVNASFGKKSGDCIPSLLNYEEFLYVIADRLDQYKRRTTLSEEEHKTISEINKILKEEGYYDL